MMIRNTLFGLTLLFGLVSSSLGQNNDIQKEERRSWDRNLLSAKLKEPLSTLSKEDEEAVEVLVNKLLYPITIRKVQINIRGSGIRMQRVTADARGWIEKVHDKSTRNVGMQKKFDSYMIKVLENIITDTRQPVIAQVNAALVMADFAKGTTDPTIGDLLVKLVKSPPDSPETAGKPNKGVQLHALRGLRNLLKQSKPAIKDEAQLNNIVSTLINFIEQKPALNVNARKNEVEGIKYLQREAVLALAQVDKPTLNSGKLRPAWTLFQVMTGMNINPAPRVDTGVAAALGLLSMKPDAERKLQLGYLAYFVARQLYVFGLVHDQEYTKANHRYPYKIIALEWKKTIEQFQKTAGNSDPLAAGFVSQANIVVDRILREQAANVTNELGRWLRENETAVQGKSLFQGDPSTAFKQPGS